MTGPVKGIDIQEQLKALVADMAEVTNGSDPSASGGPKRLIGILEQAAGMLAFLVEKDVEQEQHIAELKVQVAASKERQDRLERRQDALIENIEEVEDRLACLETADEETIPLEEVKNELGL